jgi:hypothetical protein
VKKTPNNGGLGVTNKGIKKVKDWLHNSSAGYFGVRKGKVELIYLE